MGQARTEEPPDPASSEPTRAGHRVALQQPPPPTCLLWEMGMRGSLQRENRKGCAVQASEEGEEQL